MALSTLIGIVASSGVGHSLASLPLHAAAIGSAAQDPDTDGDTMPDAWETFFGLNPNDPSDASGNPDGDGLTNAQEYAARRHPFGHHARYFAEGSTGYFDTSVGLLNLSTTDTAHVALALLTEGAGVVSHQLTLGPRQRQSISLNAVLGVPFPVAIIVESDQPIAADRAMTWGPTGVGLSLDSGSSAPATTWYFAEGATGPFFLYYLFENPGTTPANVTVRYLIEGAPAVSKSHTLPPQSRTTIAVNGEDPALALASVGAVVTSDVPILAERAMYAESGGTFGGGSASAGSNQLSTQWYFGEGATGPFFQAFLSLANPGLTAATATVTYHLSDGTTAAKAYDVPAEGRRTVWFNGEAASDPALAALATGPVWFTVSSTQPILGERAMWWADWPWYEGHAAPGSTTTDVSWAIAEGRHGGASNEQTFVLIGNTTATAGQVRLTLIPDGGAPVTRDLPIAAGERLTVNVGGLFELTDSRFSVIVDSLGTPGVPLAVDYARYRSVNGVPFSGGGAAPAIPATPATPADTAPSVTATTPANGATGASSTDNLVVTFSEAVNVAAGAFVLQCPAGTPIALTNLTASPATTFTLDPAVSLPPTTTCALTVVASAVTDADATDPPDAMAADFLATFTTAAESGPVVSSSTPTAGATQIAPGAALTLTFSEPVNVTGNWFQIVCATSGTRTVADTVVSGGPSTFTIDPTVDFAAGEACTVTVVAAQVTDQDAVDPPDNMAADHAFAFTTDVAPTVLNTTPANGAIAVSSAASLTVTFSEPVNVTGNWFQVVCATSGTRNVADTIVSGGAASFVIDPNVDFAAGELCTVTITAAQVSDQDAGDPPDTLAANFVFAFTTDTPPGVTATTPLNGSTTATTTNDLTVTFSEPVNVTGNWFQIVCATSGTRNVADTVVTGGPTTFTINPNADFAAGESCTVTIAAVQVSDQDAGDPPDTLAANHAFTFTTDAAPSVTATTPTNGATTVTNTDLTVTFSEPVNVTGNWFQIVCTTSGTRNPAATVVTGGPTTFTINPNVDFAQGETCTTTIVAAQVTDQDAADPPDTPAANHVFSFSVDVAPSITATTPTNGSTTATSNTDLTLTFSEPVNVTGNWFQIVCATSGTRNVADTVVSGGPTFTINPNSDFAAGELCTVTVFAAQVTDQDGTDPPDTMAANFVFSFTTDAAPSVTATTPTNGATQVASNTNLSLTFSEAVNVTGNWFQIVCATSGTRNVADTVVTGGPTTFGINPNADFSSGELCTVTVFAAQVTDQDGNDPPDNMAANFVFSFTIDTAPGVTTTVPTNGATGVSPNTTITVNFTESVNATTSSFTVQCPTTNQAFTLSASPAASFTLTPTPALPEGVICTVTVLAAQITDADSGDPPDNMLANHVFTFSIPPNANGDARGATGNVSMDTATTGFSVLTNDVGPGISVTAFDSASARGGVVSVNGAGLFTYSPPVGYEGVDTFNYTISNPAGSDSAAVTITVSGMLWFIDDSAAACTTIAAGCGRLATPFSTLAAFNAVDGGSTMNGGDVIDPEAGDHVFIYSGSYAGGLTVENAQRIIGQGATSSIVALTGLSLAPDSVALPSTGGTKPSITTAGFTLAQNNQVHGIAFSGTSGAAISSAANVGTLVMSDITINNTSGGGIGLTGGGTVTLTGTANTITTTTGVALNVTNTNIGAADLTFLSISANGAASGIVLANTGALGGLSVTGTGSAGSGGTIQNATGDGVSLTSTRDVSLTRMVITGTANHGISANAVNGLTLTGTQVSLAGNGDNEHGLNLVNVTGTVTIDGSTLNDAAEDLIHLANANTNVTFNVVNNSQFSHGASAGAFTNSAILLLPAGTASITATIQNTTFTNVRNVAAQIGADALGSNGTQTFTFSNNTIVIGLAGRASGVVVSGQELTTTNITIANNQFTGAGGNGVISLDTNDTSTVRGTVSGNIITNPPGIGMFVAVDEAGTTRVVLDNNVITNAGGDGIQVVNFGGTGVSNLQLGITDNEVNGHSGNGAVAFVGGISFTSFEDTSCLVLRGNTVTGTPADATRCGGAPCVDYYLQESGGVSTLEEVPDTGATTASSAYIQSINTAGSGLVQLFGTIDLTNGGICAQPLLAAAEGGEQWASACAATDEGAPLTQAALNGLVTAGLARWTAAGASEAQLAAMRGLTFEVAPLPAGTLGALDGNRVRVSRDADGRGWFVDRTPDDDSEFTLDAGGRLLAAAGSAAAGRVDLLTLVVHELAHAAGVDDRFGAREVAHVAFGELGRGERRVAAGPASRLTF